MNGDSPLPCGGTLRRVRQLSMPACDPPTLTSAAPAAGWNGPAYWGDIVYQHTTRLLVCPRFCVARPSLHAVVETNDSVVATRPSFCFVLCYRPYHRHGCEYGMVQVQRAFNSRQPLLHERDSSRYKHAAHAELTVARRSSSSASACSSTLSSNTRVIVRVNAVMRCRCKNSAFKRFRRRAFMAAR